MRVLITGGAGFIGSHSADLLLDAGYQVRILDALTPPVHVDGQLPAYLPSDAEVIVGDVRDADTLDAALRDVDLVLHLAAYQDYLTDFSTFFSTNSVGTSLLFELIHRHGHPVQRVVVASSQAVYGEGEYVCDRDGVQYPDARRVDDLRRGEWDVPCPVCGGVLRHRTTNEAVVNPHNAYAISKYSQELIALRLGRRCGIPAVALRYSITQGPRQSFHNAYSGILRIFTLSFLRGIDPMIYEDGQQLRDYVYVGDVARANLLALTDRRTDYRAFNVGGGVGTTVLEYAREIAEAVGVPYTPIASSEFRMGDTRHIVSDISGLRGLGWEPTKSTREIAAEYVSWARDQTIPHDTPINALTEMRRSGVVQQSILRTL